METKYADKPLSYHVFLLPFYCKGSTLKPSLGEDWLMDTLSDTDISSEKEERKLDYATAQYFTPEARKLLFNSKSSFMYRMDDKNRFYEIIKDGVKYRLYVNKITVTVFDNYIGVLTLHTEFRLKYQDKSLWDILKKSDGAESVLDNSRLLKAIREINEYGRRINLPYLGTLEPLKAGEDYGYFHSLVADSLSFFGETEDYIKLSKELYLNVGNHPMVGYITKPIKRLLDSLFGRSDLMPVIDDRMFVCCLVDNPELSRSIKEASMDSRLKIDGSASAENTNREQGVIKSIYSDSKLSDTIYALGFIDKEKASCNLEMRENILRRCVYNRWQGEGTIDIVTHHSFIRILGNAPDYVINPFITQYVYLATGALMQRAEILWLSNKSAELSREYFNEYDDPQNSDNMIIRKKLTELKRRYVYAQNNIFLNQLTVQEQGVEEFDMLKRELYIDDSLEKLDRTVNCIYDFTTEFAEEEESRFLSAITMIGLPFALIQLFSLCLSFSFFSGKSSWLPALFLGIVSAGSIIVSWFGLKHYDKYYLKSDKKKIVNKLVIGICAVIGVLCAIGFVIILCKQP